MFMMCCCLGYVSQKDLVSKLKEFNVLNRQEIGVFLRFVDPQ